MKTIEEIILKWKKWYELYSDQATHLAMKDQFFNFAVRCCIEDIKNLKPNI